MTSWTKGPDTSGGAIDAAFKEIDRRGKYLGDGNFQTHNDFEDGIEGWMGWVGADGNGECYSEAGVSSR